MSTTSCSQQVRRQGLWFINLIKDLMCNKIEDKVAFDRLGLPNRWSMVIISKFSTWFPPMKGQIKANSGLWRSIDWVFPIGVNVIDIY